MKNKDEKLSRRFTFRMNNFENDQLVLLADRAKMSVNSYLRELVMSDYRRYRDLKISEAEAQNWN